ncbi:hypothetical protein JKP88DRAFT_250069 [Tribonema minus]|uniref:K Homology domain-containing protein n=1 Tax=Tribonema minus TaxID=303371 RepID=A0A835YS36_9STRA|nr:hypothetical protein JKP88DRAFT_250069 [Tribonema minus]
MPRPPLTFQMLPVRAGSSSLDQLAIATEAILRITPASTADSHASTQPSCAFKMLIPSHVSGCIIGKALTGTKIKLSQNSEFFPGTNERVVLVMGEPDAVRKAVAEVLRRTSEGLRAIKHQSSSSPTAKKPGALFRAVLPMAAAGLIIGRGGETVKALGQQTGARVQLANKAQCPIATERICTVTGSMQGVLEVASFMIEKMAQEPVLSKYANPSTSYAPDQLDLQGSPLTPTTLQLPPTHAPADGSFLTPAPLFSEGFLGNVPVPFFRLENGAAMPIATAPMAGLLPPHAYMQQHAQAQAQQQQASRVYCVRRTTGSE